MKIVNAGDLDGRAYMHPDDMGAFNLDDFDVVILTMNGRMQTAIQVVSKDDCEPGLVMIDGDALSGSMLEGGAEVSLRKTVARGGIMEVQLAVEPLAEVAIETAVIWVAENASEIATLLKRRPVFRNLEISWKGAGICPLKLTVLQTVPPIRDGEAAIIDTSGGEVVFDIVPGKDMHFNAILCIDVSGSMVREDFPVGDTGEVLNVISEHFVISPDLSAFISQFRSKEHISRISSAAVAALLYLALKAKRGLGENVQFIAFGDDVEVLEMENADGIMSPVIECSGSMRALNLNTLAWYVLEKTRKACGLTAMSVALKVASDQIAAFPTNPETGGTNPTMIILLSDGNPNKGDELRGIPVNPVPVAKQELMKQGVVLYTIGLGEADDILMQKLGRDIGRGEYFRASSLRELGVFYDKLAKNFSIAAKNPVPLEISGENDVIQETGVSGRSSEDSVQKNPASIVSKQPYGVSITSKVPVGDAGGGEINLFFVATIGPGEKQVNLSVSTGSLVEKVKHVIGDLFGLIPADFHLAYGGVTMDELKIVGDYHVKHGDTVLLIPASTAGCK